jgi:hypothetical protein
MQSSFSHVEPNGKNSSEARYINDESFIYPFQMILASFNASEKTQTDIDTLYNNCVTIIKDEMENKLSKKTSETQGGG